MEYGLTNFTIVSMTRRVEKALVIKDKLIARLDERARLRMSLF